MEAFTKSNFSRNAHRRWRLKFATGYIAVLVVHNARKDANATGQAYVDWSGIQQIHTHSRRACSTSCMVSQASLQPLQNAIKAL